MGLNAVVLRGGSCVAAVGDGELRDTYSVTKVVVSTLCGIALARGDLDTVEPWRPLLTMTGGFSGEIDEVMALESGWEQAIRAWPRLSVGTFRYDNGGAHVLACELARAVGRPLDEYAAEVLFGPLGIEEWRWPCDPEGYAFGFGHLRLRTRDLARIGQAWRVGSLLDASYRADALRASTDGGPPEQRSYGHLWWLSPGGCFGAGYLGQLLWVRGDSVVAVNAGDAYEWR